MMYALAMNSDYDDWLEQEVRAQETLAKVIGTMVITIAIIVLTALSLIIWNIV